MDVILDANAIIRDYWLRGRAARRLLSEVESGEIGLFISKVVVAEVITHYRADVQRAHDVRETSDTASSRVLAQHVDQPPLDVAALVIDYGQYLRDTLARATFRAPQLSQVISGSAVACCATAGTTGAGCGSPRCPCASVPYPSGSRK